MSCLDVVSEVEKQRTEKRLNEVKREREEEEERERRKERRRRGEIVNERVR